MPMAPFYTKFPDLALKETRSATIHGYKGLPDGEYAFLEYYCDEPGCDCRRVFVSVISRDTGGKILATINYGWEDAEFYIEWMGDDTDIEKLKGPALAPPPAQQTRLAPHLLKLFKKAALEDESYIERLRRHYGMFKRAVEGEHGEHRAHSRSSRPKRKPGKSRSKRKKRSRSK